MMVTTPNPALRSQVIAIYKGEPAGTQTSSNVADVMDVYQ